MSVCERESECVRVSMWERVSVGVSERVRV